MSQGSADTISDISLTMSVPHGFRVAQDLISFPRLAGTPIVIELQFETVPNTSWPSLTALATAARVVLALHEHCGCSCYYLLLLPLPLPLLLPACHS